MGEHTHAGIPNATQAEHTDVGILNGVLVGVSELICDVAHPVLLHWSIFFVALGMVFLWHLRACGCLKGRARSRCGGRGSRRWIGCLDRLVEEHAARTLWEALLVLNFYYSPHRPSWADAYPFAMSSAFIIFETFLYVVLDMSRRGKIGNPPCTSLSKEPVCNKYMDISVTFPRAMLYFWCQLSLMCYFVYWIDGDRDTKRDRNFSALKWLVSVSLTMVAGAQEGGAHFSARYWRKLLSTRLPIFTGRDRVSGCRCSPTVAHLWLRCCMDCLVNGFGRSLLLALAPITLCVEHNTLEFLKDVVALFFVTRLDDLAEPKKFEDSLREVQGARAGQKTRGKIRARDRRHEDWTDRWLEALREERTGRAEGPDTSGSDERSSDSGSSGECSSDDEHG